MFKPIGWGITIGTVSDGSMCSKCFEFKNNCKCPKIKPKEENK